MSIILQWLARQSLAVYLTCLVGLLGYVVTAFTARRKLRAAQFSLERELIRRQITRAWIMAGLFVTLAAVVFLISRYITPVFTVTASPTPAVEVGLTPIPTATPTATPTTTPTLPSVTEALPGEVPETGEETGVTPTATPSPIPTPLPTAEPPNCPSPDVQLITPATGGTVSGVVEVRGTAQINAFAYYKFEVQFPGADTPNFISQFEAPIENGILGYWDISNAALYPAGGPYRFRLVAVDIYGNTTDCIIPVYIANQ